MACQLCERSVRVPGGEGRVFVSVPVTEVGRKVLDVVRGWPEAFEAVDGSFEGRTADFGDFLTRFAGATPWSTLEKTGIRLLFVPGDQELSFTASQQSRSLAGWLTVGESEFLATVIDEGRLVTHFHPLWDTRTETLYGWECLSRGVAADGSLIPPAALFGAAQATGMTFALDRLARQTALRTAQKAGLPGKLFINFVPTAIYDPVFCLKTTVDFAHVLGLDPGRIVFEVVETEKVADGAHLKSIVDYYRAQGFQVALDDVGSGYSSLNLLAALKPEVIKVDAAIVRGVDADPTRQAVFRALSGIAAETGSLLLAEGIETEGERDWAMAHGAVLAQGFLWGRPRANPTIPADYRALDRG
jgi:EAL domain-containing protein (putative c-di-GMP-specific phosphodiesterase class I)